MPFKALKPCNKPGCPLVSDTRYCEDHAELSKQADLYRGTASSRGYDAEWRRVRLHALKRDKHLCQHCLKVKSRVTAATEVHHLLKITTHPHMRLVLDALLSVCHDCHEELEKIAA
jgi:5-methylcytosine-specific restriction protein A